MNVIALVGNMVADPELRWTQTGRPACNFRVAVNRNYKGADGKTPTDFINCVSWGPTAEVYVAKFGRKGRKVSVVGSLYQRSFTAKDGSTRHTYEVQCNDVSFVDSNPAQQGQAQPQQQGPPPGYQDPSYQQQQPAQPQARSEPWPPPQQQAPPQQAQQPHQETYQTNFDEELPF